MNAMSQAHRLLSLDEYLVFERMSDIRHEYIGGYLTALRGESVRHNQVTMNIAIALRQAAHDRQCHVLVIDLKCQVADDVMYYPDVIVTYNSAEDDPYIVRKPTLIAEVLSPTTHTIDLREKWLAYKRVESLQHYLIASQDNWDIIHYWRDANGEWQREDVLLPRRQTVKLPFLDLEVPLEEIYDDVI